MKADILATDVDAHLERHVVQTTSMKRGHGKVLQPYKQRTHVKVCATCEGVLPNIEHDHFERETLVYLQRNCNQTCENLKDLQPHKWHMHAKVCVAHKCVLPNIDIECSKT